MSHISSAYRLLTTCVYVHVRKGAREGFSIESRCKLVRRTRTKEIGLVVFVRSSSDGNGARLRLSSAKLLLLFARFPIFPIIETPIPYNSAYSIFYLLEKG